MPTRHIFAHHPNQKLHEVHYARYVDTQAFEEATEEESQRPRFWRYWMGLPPKGRTAIFYGGLTLG